MLRHVPGGQPRSRPTSTTPEEFQIDRAHNRHVAFGLGIHRCIGSNLARLEMTVGLQEWLRAFPNFELDPERETVWANGQVRGPRCLPVLLHRIDLVNFCARGAQEVHENGAAAGKRREPRRCGRLRSAPSGASQADRSTTGRTSGVSLQLDQSHRPSRLAAWRAMPRFGTGSGFPLPTPLSPIHADPVARAIGPGANRNRPH